MIGPLLFAGLLEQVLIGDAGDIAFVDIAVKRIRGNGPFAFEFQSADNLGRRFAGTYPVGYSLCVSVVITQFERTAFNGGLLFGVGLGDIGRVALDGLPGGAVQVVIQSTLYFIMEGGHGKACFLGHDTIGNAGVVELFYDEAVCPGHMSEFLCHALIPPFC